MTGIFDPRTIRPRDTSPIEQARQRISRAVSALGHSTPFTDELVAPAPDPQTPGLDRTHSGTRRGDRRRRQRQRVTLRCRPRIGTCSWTLGCAARPATASDASRSREPPDGFHHRAKHRRVAPAGPRRSPGEEPPVLREGCRLDPVSPSTGRPATDSFCPCVHPASRRDGGSRSRQHWFFPTSNSYPGDKPVINARVR